MVHVQHLLSILLRVDHLRDFVLFDLDAERIAVETDTDDDDVPKISLQEMLDDLHITDATGGAGADMME